MSSLRADLLGLFTTLPGLNDSMERKAFIGFTDYAFVGIYLDWSGSQAAFAEVLIDEISRRGQHFTVAFLGSALKVPQVGLEAAVQMDAIARQIEALRPEEWLAEFPVETLTAQARSALVADLDMLAAAVVSSTLLPFYALGADGLSAQAGAHAAQVAKAVAERVKSAVAERRLLRSVLATFTQKPVETEGELLCGLRELLEGDNELALDLAKLLTVEPQAEEATLQAMVNVAQSIRKVQGNVVGVIVGADVLTRIAGLAGGGGTVANVQQTLGTVQADGVVVGAIIGGEQGAVHVGGQQQYGDTVSGDKTQLDTGGGDYIGRDKHVGGDEVHGDKIGGGKVNLGGGARDVRFGDVTIIQGGSQPEHQDTKPLIEEAIRLDVAAPRTASLDEPFDVAVAVRQPEAPVLTLEALTGVASSEGGIFRREEDEVVKYRVELTGAGYEIVPPYYIVKLRPRANSRPYFFQVIPRRPGIRVLFVNAYQDDDTLAAQTHVRIEIVVPVEPHG